MENQSKKKPTSVKEYDKSVVENFLGVKNLDPGKKRVEAAAFKPNPFNAPPNSPISTTSEHEPEYIIDPESPLVKNDLRVTQIGQFEFIAQPEKRAAEPSKEKRDAKRRNVGDPAVQKKVLEEMEKRVQEKLEIYIDECCAKKLAQFRIDYQHLVNNINQERQFNWALFKKQHDVALQNLEDLNVLKQDYNNRYATP